MVASDETPALVSGGRIVSKKGGDVELDSDQAMEAPGGVLSTDYGAAFGPLEIIAYPKSTVRVSGLTFKTEPGALEGLFGSGDGECRELSENKTGLSYTFSEWENRFLTG